MGMLANRLRKKLKHLSKWAQREQVSCFRVYQHDIPEYPVIADVYEDQAVAWLARRKIDETEEQQQNFAEVVKAELLEGLDLQEDNLFLKTRRPGGQYRRKSSRREEFIVKENGLKYSVNLSDYHDTGLFLDHRPLRQKVFETSRGLSVLNLFCYTGSFTVCAAKGGAKETVSVDLSERYLEKVAYNLRINVVPPHRHSMVRDDVMAWLPFAAEQGFRFDLIICDPPTFSNSKKSEDMFEVSRDGQRLINQSLQLLNPGGRLYFSCNRKGFVLPELELETLQVNCQDITPQTIPYDFQGLNPHCCWQFDKTRP